jgi:hypothetical protein
VFKGSVGLWSVVLRSVVLWSVVLCFGVSMVLGEVDSSSLPRVRCGVRKSSEEGYSG